MAKTRTKEIAHILYTRQSLSAKAIALKLNVTEKTVGRWVRAGGWRDELQAITNNPSSDLADLKELIFALTRQRLALQTDSNVSFKEKARIGDEISKWTKLYQVLQDQNVIPLWVQLQCMTDIFTEMNKFDPTLHNKSISFQESYLEKISKNA